MIGSFPKYKKRNLSQKTLIHKKPKPSNGLTYVTHAFMTQFRTARAQFRLLAQRPFVARAEIDYS